MKKLTLLLSILLVMLLMLTACGKAQNNTEVIPSEPAEEPGMLITPPPETYENPGNLITTTPNPTELPEDEVEASTYYIETVYAEQISRYFKAVSEQWEEGRYYEEEMSPLASYYYEGNPLDNVGFALEDLDHDGSWELIIGGIKNSDLDPAIFEVWTLKNGVPTLLCQSGYRNRYYLEYLQDDDSWLIANVGSGSAACSASHYYYLENGELKVVMGIVFDAFSSEAAPWFMAFDDDWDISNDTPIDEATAASITESHQDAYTVPDYFPYSLY